MNTALLAIVILVAVYSVVAIQAWSANRSLRPAMEAAARQTLKARENPRTYAPQARPPLTREQSRTLLIVFAILFLGAYGAVFGGILLVNREGFAHGFGIGLMAGGVALLFGRPVILRRVRRTIVGREETNVGDDAG